MTFSNCGDDGAHFVPPSFGEDGFFTCSQKAVGSGDDLLDRADAHMVRRIHPLMAELIARVRAQKTQIANLTACYESVQASGRALREQINALTYCPYCGQGHAMHTADCRILPLLTTTTGNEVPS